MTPRVDPFFLAAAVLKARYRVSQDAAMSMLICLAHDSEIDVATWCRWLLDEASPEHEPRRSECDYDQTPLGRFIDRAGRRRRVGTTKAA